MPLDLAAPPLPDPTPPTWSLAPLLWQPNMPPLDASVPWEELLPASLRCEPAEASWLVPWQASLGDLREPRARWEVHRLQFLLPLSTARPTKTAAERVTSALAQWTRLAQCGSVPAWESPMEVALRLLTLTAVAGRLRGQRPWDRWWRDGGGAFVALHEHWLADRLEDDSLRPSNHALINLSALVCHHAAREPMSPRTAQWARALEYQCRRQFLPDGTQYERSTGYHRFVTEALLLAVRALRARHIQRPGLEERAAAACGFLDALGEPLPLIGDHDSSSAAQFHALDDPASKVWWRPLAEELFGQGATARIALFPDTGLAVLRRGAARLTLSAGVGGQAGRGGHAHNDQLSVTLAVGDRWLVVDPGTSAYLSDLDVRRRERSAAVHSAPMLGGEPYRICREAPFALPQSGQSGIVADHVSARGWHAWRDDAGLARRLERRVRFVADNEIEVEDRVERGGEAGSLEVRWHLPGAWSHERIERGVHQLRNEGAVIRLEAPWAEEARTEPARWAPEFSRCEESTILIFRNTGSLSAVTRMRWNT